MIEKNFNIFSTHYQIFSDLFAQGNEVVAKIGIAKYFASFTNIKFGFQDN